MNVPYGLIPLVASIALAIHHALLTDASTGSKVIVTVIGEGLGIRLGENAADQIRRTLC